MHIITALLIVSISTLLIFTISQIAMKKKPSFSEIDYVNFQISYQLGLLLLASTILIILYLLYPTNFGEFIQLGNISAPVEAVDWLGIEDNETWLSLGLSLSFFITFITATFIYFQLKKENITFNSLIPYLPWIVIFSLSNSFAEEVIYRLGVIIPLYGKVDTSFILLFSAIAFGLPHFRGMPNGIIGVFMAALLGWLLAKSVLETNGYFWAWFIHFLQDVVIFSALVLLNQNKQKANS